MTDKWWHERASLREVLERMRVLPKYSAARVAANARRAQRQRDERLRDRAMRSDTAARRHQAAVERAERGEP